MKTTTGYRDILRNKYQLRADKNVRYSMRAFAKDLGMSSSSLSEVIGGKKGLSPAKASVVAMKLKLDEVEMEYFVNLVASEHSRSTVKRAHAKFKIQTYKKHQVRNLNMESFSLIYDWYHFAILEATHLKTFQPSNQWLAKRLGVSEDKIKMAVDRLISMDLLEITPRGQWIDTQVDLATPDGFSFSYLRNFHRQLIERALAALEEQSVEERDITSLIVSLDQRRLPEAKRKIRDFKSEFIKEFNSKDESKDAVYCLGIQMFNLTQMEKV